MSKKGAMVYGMHLDEFAIVIILLIMFLVWMLLNKGLVEYLIDQLKFKVIIWGR